MHVSSCFTTSAAFTRPGGVRPPQLCDGATCGFTRVAARVPAPPGLRRGPRGSFCAAGGAPRVDDFSHGEPPSSRRGCAALHGAPRPPDMSDATQRKDGVLQLIMGSIIVMPTLPQPGGIAALGARRCSPREVPRHHPRIPTGQEVWSRSRIRSIAFGAMSRATCPLLRRRMQYPRKATHACRMWTIRVFSGCNVSPSRSINRVSHDISRWGWRGQTMRSRVAGGNRTPPPSQNRT